MGLGADSTVSSASAHRGPCAHAYVPLFRCGQARSVLLRSSLLARWILLCPPSALSWRKNGVSRYLEKRSIFLGFPGGAVLRNLPANAGDVRDGAQSRAS